jgi:hypothetical protein
VQRVGASVQARRERPDGGRAVTLQKLRSGRGGELRARALNEAIRSRAAHVVRNELRMQDHVAVDEHDVLGARPRNRAVAGASEAKALVLLPDVLERQTDRAPALDHSACGRAGAVVGDDYFVWPLRLPGYAGEREVQGFGPVIRRYDQAGAHLRGAARSGATGREHAALCALAKACTDWRPGGPE